MPFLHQPVQLADDSGNPVTSANPIPVRTGGAQTATVAAGAALVVKNTAGRLDRILVTTTGTAALSIYDNPSAASGTVIGIVPANATAGTVIVADMPAALGIYVPATASGPALTISYR